MKKTILSLAVLTATIFASCSKDSDVATPSMPSTVDPAGGSVISLTLTGDSTSQISASRADSDTVLAEEWESELSTLTIFAFDNSDNLLVRRDLSDTEVSSKAVSFALPKSAASTSCTFYAVANIDASSAVSKSTLLGLIDGDASDYNASYSAVTGGAMRDDGFVMSGSTTMDVGAENTTTKVGITIKRTVAKVALELSTSDTFKASYPTATLTFNSATISNAASQTPVIFTSDYNSGEQSFTHTQATESTPSYLFYIYEFGGVTAGYSENVVMSINATFDADGDSSTTADQSEIIYSFELEGDGAGVISRNGLYNITAKINGLVGQDCDVTIEVADWETPVTQSVNLGM